MKNCEKKLVLGLVFVFGFGHKFSFWCITTNSKSNYMFKFIKNKHKLMTLMNKLLF